ncbi:autoinducer binding domain-containing protein [Epibacterium ulvae]|uniref:autoinducer binding domain-containing protein n=1 Tax=Epibacterium ulvae TaxID=1156985 RepID=UPI0024926B41|nr:autoinducer binding domain-containing protein [Epibacterium ulvae]
MKLPVQEKFDAFGFVTLAPGQVPTSAQTTFPETWHSDYFANNFHHNDPVFAFASGASRRSAALLLNDEQMQGDLFDAARAANADSNFACVSLIGGSKMVFGGVNKDLDERILDKCKTLCQATHRLELSKKIGQLNDDQIDLMEMFDEGLLDKEIASDLGITLSAIAQRKRTICKIIGTGSFRATVQLYSVHKWGGYVEETLW